MTEDEIILARFNLERDSLDLLKLCYCIDSLFYYLI